MEIKKKLNIKSRNYLKILEIIQANHFKARIVGGAVRDAIINKQAYDIDIATNMRPCEGLDLFSSLGYKVIPIGIKFGTISVIFNKEIFEITTLRKDISCDGRHAKVEYCNDFYLDALRRDFTINALSYCPIQEIIYDYFQGIEDLTNRQVKFIGIPNQRIAEDYLRILRFFRFHGRFGKQIHTESFNACIKNKSALKKLSKERIKSEFDMILKLDNYLEVLSISKEIIPEIFPINSIDKAIFVKAEKIAKKLQIKLSDELKYALLFYNHDISLKCLVDLKFSKKQASKVHKLINLKPDNDDKLFLTNIWLNHENYIDFGIFLMSVHKKFQEMESVFLELYNKPKPKFPVNGNDLKFLKLKGPQIKNTLEALKNKWIKSKFTLTKTELLEIDK